VDRDPTAAAQGSRLWVIWSVFAPRDGRWSLEGRILQGAASTVAPLPGDATQERRRPAAVVDSAGGLWLFWLERPNPLARWTVKYNRHNGTNWDTTVPHSLGGNVHVEEDLFAFFEASSGTIKLYWSRRDQIASLSGALRWRLFSRTKAGLNPAANDWGAVTAVGVATPGNHDDREPFAFAAAGGTEVLFSSNRGGAFAIWSLPPVGPAIATGTTPFSERGPLAFLDGGQTFLICRSNRGVSYRSGIYEATETVDLRYAGGTSANTHNPAKLALRRKFDDFQTYSYDTGPAGVRRNGDWYARDTVGLYVTPPGATAAAVLPSLQRLSQGLRAFMPATVRAVLTPSADLATETVVPGLDTAGLP
jgi:hypothetical protein